MSNYDESAWANVTPDMDYGLGTVWHRFQLLAKDDPYVGFFSEHVINQIATSVTDLIGDAEKSHIIINTPDELREKVWDVMDRSPLFLLVTDQFKRYVIELFLRCTFPKWETPVWQPPTGPGTDPARSSA